MAMLEWISEEDVVGIVRLLGEVAGMSGVVAERRVRLISGVAEMVGADVWAWAGTRMTGDGRMGPLYLHDGGYANEYEQEMLIRYSSLPKFWEGVFGQYAERVGGQRAFGALVLDPEWGRGGEAGEVIKEAREKSGLDHVMFMMFPLGEGMTSVIGIHRRGSKPVYTERERAIVQLVFGQVEWLHRAGTDVEANVPVMDDLTPRLREVLMWLTAGKSRKQIAKRMGISVDTVSGYCKDLHRKFSVSTKGELLAKFIGR